MPFDPVSHKDSLLRLAEAVERFQYSNSFLPEARELLPAGLRELVDHAHEYNRSAQQNLEWWEDTLSEVSNPRTQLEEHLLLRLTGVLGRIFRESDIVRGVKPNGVREKFFRFFSRNDLEGEFAEHGEFIRNLMSIYVTREVERRASSLLQSVEQAADGWDKSFQEYVQKVERYKKNLEDQAQKYNFMGLAHAFNTVVDSKETESKIQLSILVLIALALIAVPGYSFFFPDTWVATIEGAADLQQGALAHVIVTIALEIVLVYLFRVVLKSYIATQNQVVNLKLRSSLCAFVEQYASFAQTIKNKDQGNILARFEQVVFSHAPTYEGKIPEVTDGAEQMIEIAKTFRK